MAKQRKMEDRSADVKIYGIAAEDGEKTRKAIAGVYVRSERPEWSKSPIHFFRPDGEDGLIGVWGSAAIDRGLRTVPQGAYVELEYRGMRDLDNGNTMKDIAVRVEAGTATLDPERDGVPF